MERGRLVRAFAKSNDMIFIHARTSRPRSSGKMSIYDKQPIDLEKISTYILESRPSKVTIADFSNPVNSDDSLKEFLDNLPDILAVKSLREIAAQIRRAKDLQKPIIWGIGGHVIKTGLAQTAVGHLRDGNDGV